MNIVVLDSDPAFGSASPEGGTTVGALEFPQLESLGTVTSFPSTRSHQVIERSEHAEIILTNKVVLGAEEFERLPRLRMVSVLATGVNVIDLQAASRHGIVVCNVPGYSTASTAQHAIALLLELVNHVGLHGIHVRAGHYRSSPAFSYFLRPLTELEGKVLGIVGLGAIGSRVGQIARALGMEVIATTRTPRVDSTFPSVTLDQLLSASDVVSLHCPLTEETRHLINQKTLRRMKRGAYLLNVARGPIVDEAALAAALEDGHLAGAGVDVLDTEPPRDGSPLLCAPHCIVTPHLAWATTEARGRLLTVTIRNIQEFLAGNPQNVVSLQ